MKKVTRINAPVVDAVEELKRVEQAELVLKGHCPKCFDPPGFHNLFCSNHPLAVRDLRGGKEVLQQFLDLKEKEKPNG